MTKRSSLLITVICSGRDTTDISETQIWNIHSHFCHTSLFDTNKQFHASTKSQQFSVAVSIQLV